ncbi:MAG TPA: hypothetical protein VF821_06905 [Lentzea sp.]
MKTVTGVWFEEEDRREVERAVRWIGIHPQSENLSGRDSQRRPSETVRQRVAALVHSITESNEPVFAERLERLVGALDEVYAQAYLESDVSYWTEQGMNGTQAEVFATSRGEALVDLGAALEVLRAALPLAESVQALVEVTFEGV